MNMRDRDYIEARLIAPCTGVLEAHERLQACGEGEKARELMEAVQSFTDACRAIRQTLTLTK